MAGLSVALLFDPGIRSGIAECAAAVGRLRRLAPPALPRPVPLPAAAAVRQAWSAGRVRTAALCLAWGLGGAAVLAGIAGLFATALTSVPAIAAPLSELFAGTGRTDRFLAGLHAIAGGDARALAGMFGLFNLAVLVLCGLVILAMTAQAVLDTARGGRPGASGVLVVRVVLALALAVPLGGFNAAQHLVLAVAGFGGSAADRLWSRFSTDAIGSGTAPMPLIARSVHRALVADLLVAETCLETANRLAATHGDPAYVAVRTRAPDGAGHLVIGYDGTGRGLPPGACGAVRFAPGAGDGAAGHVVSARFRALDAIVPDLRDMARDIVDRLVADGPRYGMPLPDLGPELERRGIAQTYARVLQQGIARARHAAGSRILSGVERQARDGGWLAAPLVFNAIAREAGGVQAAVREVPEVDPPAPTLGHAVPEWPRILERLETALTAAGTSAGVPAAVAPDSDRLLFRILDQVWQFRSDLVDADAPLTGLAAIGHTLVSGAIQAFGVVAGLVIGNSLLRAIPLVGDGLDVAARAWQVLDAPVTTALMALLFAGLVLAYLVPLIPFIRFLFALATWLFQLVTGLVGVGLWLLAWLSMDRDRLAPGNVRTGALLLLALLLRPPLMVIGLLLGLLVATVLVRYLNDGFAPLIASVTADGPGPIGRIAWTVIYTVLAWITVNLSFAAVDRLPAGVLAWLDARAGDSDDGGDAGRSITAALARSERLAPRLAPPGSGPRSREGQS